MYSEAAEVRSSYKKSYLWWFRHLDGGNWTGSNWTKIDRVHVHPAFVWGRKGGEWVVRFRVCGVTLIGLILVRLMSFSGMVSMVLILREVGTGYLI